VTDSQSLLLVVVLVVAVCLVACVMAVRARRARVRDLVTVEGRVVETGGLAVGWVTVDYPVPGGWARGTVRWNKTRGMPVRVGQPFKVLVDPQDPQRVQMAGLGRDGALAVVAGAFAAITAFGGLLALVVLEAVSRLPAH